MTWKDIPGFNRYKINESGEVLDDRKKVILHGKLYDRYLKVALYYDGQQHKTFLATIHQLVANAFIPNPDNKPHINHIDGNKLNNSLSNLEWCTQQENTRHAYDNNLINKMIGSKNHRAKLNDDLVRSLRDMMCDTDMNVIQMAELTGINKGTLRDCLQGKTWGHVDYRIDETKATISHKFHLHLKNNAHLNLNK